MERYWCTWVRPNFLEHFKVYVAHVQEWRTQFQKLESVDLRYEHQVIVNPDSQLAPSEAERRVREVARSAAARRPVAEQESAAAKKTKKHT